MTTWIVRVGESLMIEIPAKLAEQVGLEEGQAVEWIANDHHHLEVVKKTVSDGLLEVEQRVTRENTREQWMIEERRRAELGEVDAQSHLGMMTKNKAEAADWFRRAAEQGDRFSMSCLGHLLVAGDGIEANLAEGYFWLLLSTSSYSLKSTKHERAKMGEERRELQRISKRLTQEERACIEDRCRDWLNSHSLAQCFMPKL